MVLNTGSERVGQAELWRRFQMEERRVTEACVEMAGRVLGTAQWGGGCVVGGEARKAMEMSWSRGRVSSQQVMYFLHVTRVTLQVSPTT